MTRIELAKKGIITEEVKGVAISEGVSPESLASDIAKGLTVIPRNIRHEIRPIGIGKGLKTKVNANIGTSKDRIYLDDEKEKLSVVIKYGADAVMDLSTGGHIKELRQILL
ncbi:MAG: phosphomethylpyrimidine synthase ThiC, partial [Nitrospirae bacterium]|nr:phosphomethylpyrimidine synthase ThiC [Nitrospirota bacterium]